MSASTIRASVSSTGQQADNINFNPCISADGRYVTFRSFATNLVSGDTNAAWDVFTHDRVTGETARVSVSSTGQQANGNSQFCCISSNGRHVAFESEATNLVSSDSNSAADIFVHDTKTGETVRVSVSTSGQQGDASSWRPSISADGRYVAFQSDATNLVSGDSNSATDIFVHDRVTGKTVRVSVSSSGQQGNASSWRPSISADGRYVAFQSDATNLVSGDSNSATDIFVHDTKTGETVRASVSSGGQQGNSDSSYVSISADGRHVSFHSSATNLVSGDSNGHIDVFVRDLVANKTVRASVSSGGQQGDADSHAPSISEDGRCVAFYSDATNLVSGDGNSAADVFVRDMEKDETVLVSVSSSGQQGDATSQEPSISDDGRYVTFYSSATDLVSDDTNGYNDVFVHDRGASYSEVQVAGSTRYTTAIEASKRAYPYGAGKVVIATGANWPDALGGAALAGVLEAPLLLTTKDAVPSAVMDEIERLGAEDAYILGGTGAVSQAVEDSLDSELAGSVTRLWGVDRYGTAQAIADKVIELQGASYAGDAFVATGDDFPDALGASPLAAAYGAPILLTRKDAMPYMPSKVDSAVILGGEGAVTKTTEDAIEAHLGAANVTRIGGVDRYETAAKVAEHGVAGSMHWDQVGIATGANFPDALSGGAMLGRLGTVLMLTRPTSLPTFVQQRLEDNKSAIADVHFLGGTGAVSQSVRDDVAQIVQ